MAALVVTIKTVGQDIASFDATLRAQMQQYADDSKSKDTQDLRALLGLSPLTGSVVSLAVYDTDRKEGAVYFVSGATSTPDERLGACIYKCRDEVTMLAEFWEGVQPYDTVVTFNGRSFVLPFLLHRSAILQVRPSCDLLRYRYLTQQVPPYHVDLYDQLTFYGAMRKPATLSLLCHVYGIPSIQLEGIQGSDTYTLYQNHQYREIALTAGADVLATALLYEKWRTYLAPVPFVKSEITEDI